MPTIENLSARTESLTASGRPRHQPSQRALATRSLTAAERLTGEARREVSAYYLTCRSPYGLTCRSVSAS